MIEVIRLPIMEPNITSYLVLPHVQGFSVVDGNGARTLAIQVNGELMEFTDAEFITRFMSRVVDNT